MTPAEADSRGRRAELLEAGREAPWRGAGLTVVTAFQRMNAVPPMASIVGDRKRGGFAGLLLGSASMRSASRPGTSVPPVVYPV